MGERRIFRAAPAGLVAASGLACVLTAVFWLRSCHISDQVAWGRTWCDSWNGRIVCFFDDPPRPHAPRYFSWWSNPSSQDDFGLINPRGTIFGIQYDTENGALDSVVIPYGWMLFFASLPADAIGLFWTFQWSRKKDAATGGHLTVRISLYLAVIISLILVIVLLLS